MKCRNPDHPHCTHWVLPGADACAAGHTQPRQPSDSSFGLLHQLRAARDAGLPISVPTPAALAQEARAVPRPYLHISGFDPRAAGGRQALRLDLRAFPDEGAREAVLVLESALLPHGRARHSFDRARYGQWRPVFIEFSSRGLEHGQYRIDAELHSIVDGRVHRKWACTLVLLVPRADASLSEIHQTFLASHKNVRVSADDAAIARVHARTGGGRVDIDVKASNAGIAHLDMDEQGGKIDLGFPTIAWDEDLIELDMPPAGLAHPHPTQAASLVNAAPDAGQQRHLRLFALDECVLGRWEDDDAEANLLLAHHGAGGPDAGGLTRRISAHHAVIRCTPQGAEIEDISRYGILLDGVWPGKYAPVPLRLGMRIELTASIKGIVVLEVSALLPNGVILHRLDQGRAAEAFYVLAPDLRPPAGALARTLPHAAMLPQLFHADGGFWHRDTATGRDTALAPQTQLDRLQGLAAHARFAAEPYPEAVRRTAAVTAGAALGATA
ncbi:MAG: FHA domain-containing protein [Telluria sp.]